jgi:WD40 repeat protein
MMNHSRLASLLVAASLLLPIAAVGLVPLASNASGANGASRAVPQQLPKQTQQASIDLVLFSPDGSLLLTLQSDNKTSFWDVEKRTEIWSGVSQSAQAAAFFPDGKRLVLGCRTGNLLLWDVPKRELLANCADHNQSIVHLAVFANQQRLLSIGGWAKPGTEIKIWNVDKATVEHSFVGTRIAIPLHFYVDRNPTFRTVNPRLWSHFATIPAPESARRPYS